MSEEFEKPKNPQDPRLAHITAAYDRMVEIGWIKRYAFTENGFAVEWFPGGEEKVMTLFFLMKELGAKDMDKLGWWGVRTAVLSAVFGPGNE